MNKQSSLTKSSYFFPLKNRFKLIFRLLRKKNHFKNLNIKDFDFRKKNVLMEKIFNDRHLHIVHLDAHFNFIKVNKAYAKIFSREPDYFKGKSIYNFLPDKESKGIFKDVIKTCKPYISSEKPLEYKNHHERGITYWDWSLYPVKNLFNKINGFVIILIDITDMVNTRKDLEKVQKDLAKSKHLKDLGTLAATIAHELRNPLGVILAAVFNVKRKNKDPALEKHLNNIEKKIIESDQIINNLLNYSNIKNPVFENININDLLEESIATLKTRFFKNEIIIEKKTDMLKDKLIKIDPLQIKEVLANILNNSCEALPQDKGKIVIKGNIKDNFAVISIRDNGKGIEKKDIEHIFEPFFTKKTKGTGLGLSICKDMIELHNGKIFIKSKKNIGTTLTINLPL